MNLTSIVRPATVAAIVALSAVAIPEAFAQEPSTIQSGPVQAVTGSAQRITMTMGKGQLFKTSVPFTKVSVTDDKIVDVTPQSNWSSFLRQRVSDRRTSWFSMRKTR